jgi:DNA polymerase III subunit gamma/tau
MASQSLYRKWRSQTFSDLVGQESIIRTLKNGLNSDKPAQAYLFTGPRGTGKTSMARLLAKTINCLNPKDGEPCNVCEQCREITAGASFNVIEIDAASNRGIDSIRELRDKVMMPPATGRYKVYILDEAHMLTTEAFNALLKTLEEPPPHAIFVMATTDVHKMLPTVLSRCQIFNFKRFSLRQLVDRLNYVASEEHVMLEQGAVELLARAASGGMRDALSLLDQAIAYAGQTISLAHVQTMLGVADPQAIQKLILMIAQLESPEGLHLIHELSEAGADLRQLNTQIAEYFRAMMLVRAGANITKILDTTESDVNEITRMAQLFALEELTECARVFAQNELMQKNLGTPQLALELVLLTCVELHRKSGNVGGGPVRPSIQAPRISEPPARQPSAPSLVRQVPPRQEIPQPTATPIRTSEHQESASQAERQVTPSTSVSQQEVHNPPPVAIMPAEEVQVTPVASIAPLIETDNEDEEETVVDEGTLPEWDSLSYADDSDDEEADEAPEEAVPTVEPAKPAEPAPTSQPPQSVLVSSARTPLEPFLPITPVTSPQEIEPAEQAPSVAQGPTLTVQDVKERWEYIKRRVRSRSMKDGSLIQALLNDYTVLAIEGSNELPVVVLRAGADFHFKQLQNNEERRKVIEWAMKVELQQECRVKLVQPGQFASSMTIPPPSDNSPGSTLNSSMLAMPRSNSAFQERPVGEKPSSAQEFPHSQNSQNEISARSTAIPVPPVAHETQNIVSAYTSVTPSELPLARTRVVRENTTVEKVHVEERSSNRQAHLEQQARTDPVAREIVRLFKAEMKEVRPQ